LVQASCHFKRRRTVLITAACATATFFGAAADACGQAPNEEWRTLETEHFRVTFPAHLEELGRRAATARSVRGRSSPPSSWSRPDGVIDVLVTDHADVSNGFAQVTPVEPHHDLRAPSSRPVSRSRTSTTGSSS
jgi:hypothetical protein